MNNIMWFKQGTEIVGVLCDWDLAEDHSNGDLWAVDVGQSGVAVPDKGKGKAVTRDSSSPTNKTDPPPRAQSEPRRSPRVNTCPLSSDTELETAGTPDPAPADVALPKGCPDYCVRVLVRPHDMPAHRRA